MRKKLFVLTALMAVVSAAQADDMYWADGLLGDTSTDWTSSSWYNGTDGVSHHVPTNGDAVFIQDFSLGNPIPNQPVVSANVTAHGIPDFLFIGWDSGTAGSLTFTTGGHLETSHTRLGNGIGATGTITMNDGWSYMNANILELGYNLVVDGTNLVAGGNGVINLGANATLHVYGAFYFGQDSGWFGQTFPIGGTATGSGQVNMFGGGSGAGARFIVNGDLTATGDGRATNWINNGWIAAPNSGEEIIATYDGGSGWTEFNVVGTASGTLVLSDNFYTGGVATNDLNYNQGTRQSGLAKPSGLWANTNIVTLTTNDEFNVRDGAVAWTDTFDSHIGSESFSIKIKGTHEAASANWAMLTVQSAINADWDKSPISVNLWHHDFVHLMYGDISNVGASNLLVDMYPALVTTAIGATYDANDEHEFEIRAIAETDTTGTWGFYIDGAALATRLPYAFEDSAKNLTFWTEGSGGSDITYDDLNISTISDLPEWFFLDDFNASDSAPGDLNAANWGYGARQAQGEVVTTWTGNPDLYTITNSALHHEGGWLWQDFDYAGDIVGEDFEFTFKIAQKHTGGEWTSIYLYDDTIIGDTRADSRFGMYLLGADSDLACVLYRGTGVQELTTVSTNEVAALTGLPYDKADVHTYQLISTAGIGGINSYDLVIDDVVIRSGLKYSFDGVERHIGMVTGGDLSAGGGAAYDDIGLRIRPAVTAIVSDTFDTPDSSNVNADTAARQAGGLLLSSYSGAVGDYSIVSNKLHSTGIGTLLHDADMGSRVVGADFEFSFEVTQMETSSWFTVYLDDETIDSGSDARGSSRLGCLVWGGTNGNNGVAFSLYAGTGANQVSGGDVTVSNLTVQLGYPYVVSDPHTVKFISYAGDGGTNSYMFVVDDVTIVSGVEYLFDSDIRKIEMHNNHDAPTGLGVDIDDLDVRLNFDKPSYESWANGMGLVAGVNDGREYDAENGGIGDGMVNLLEYALGGDPLADDAASILPAYSGPVDIGGTNYMNYVYRRRSDAGIRGLVYDLQFKTDLMLSPNWTSTLGLAEAGIDTTDPDFDMVTNSIPTVFDYSAVPGYEDWVWDEQLFLNLEITEN